MNINYSPILTNNEFIDAFSHYFNKPIDYNSAIQCNIPMLSNMDLLKLQQNAVTDHLYYNQLQNLKTTPINNANIFGSINTIPTGFQNNFAANSLMGIQNTMDGKNYHQEAYNLFLSNNLITTKINELIMEKHQILAKLSVVDESKNQEKIKNQVPDELPGKKKRQRRVASQIDRHYKCPSLPCAKSYGSEGSLYQHIKLKHKNFNISTLLMAKDKKSTNLKSINHNNKDIIPDGDQHFHLNNSVDPSSDETPIDESNYILDIQKSQKAKKKK